MRNEVRIALMSEVASLLPPASYAVQYPNQPFEMPQDKAWVQVLLVWQGRNRLTLGRNYRFEHTGMLQFDTYDKQDRGTARMDSILDIIEPHFSGKQIKTGDITVSLGEPWTPSFSSKEGLARRTAAFPFSAETSATITT